MAYENKCPPRGETLTENGGTTAPTEECSWKRLLSGGYCVCVWGGIACDTVTSSPTMVTCDIRPRGQNNAAELYVKVLCDESSS